MKSKVTAFKNGNYRISIYCNEKEAVRLSDMLLVGVVEGDYMEFFELYKQFPQHVRENVGGSYLELVRHFKCRQQSSSAPDSTS